MICICKSEAGGPCVTRAKRGASSRPETLQSPGHAHTLSGTKALTGSALASQTSCPWGHVFLHPVRPQDWFWGPSDLEWACESQGGQCKRGRRQPERQAHPWWRYSCKGTEVTLGLRPTRSRAVHLWLLDSVDSLFDPYPCPSCTLDVAPWMRAEGWPLPPLTRGSPGLS